MYTSHGHHIPGTIKIGPYQGSVARCGGPGLCRICSQETGMVIRVQELTDAVIENRNEKEDKMSLAIQKYNRRSFPVDAVQVTPENFEEVAKWCHGSIQENGDKEGHLSRRFIKVKVANPRDETQTQAYFGDWVLKSGRSFKIYRNPAFEKTFEPAVQQSKSSSE